MGNGPDIEAQFRQDFLTLLKVHGYGPETVVALAATNAGKAAVKAARSLWYDEASDRVIWMHLEPALTAGKE